jgi:predicted nucleic acid-binding Zn ribbon protein
MTPEQRRKNKRMGLILLVFVLSVMAWVIYRQVELIYFPS